MLLRLTLFPALILMAIASIGTADAKTRSPADQALYAKAYKACNGPMWPNGARIVINYSGGWYRCEDIGNHH